MNLGGHRRKQSWLVLRDCSGILLGQNSFELETSRI
jgi:hypothetical protein